MAAELEIERMNVQEKLRAMEALRDSLCRQEETIPVPQWHKDILDEREQAIRDGKAKFIEWEAAKQQISEKLS